MNNNTPPEQLRIAAEIFEKNLPFLAKHPSCDKFEETNNRDPLWWIMKGYEISIAQPPAEVAQPFNLAAHVISNGFRALADGEKFHREDFEPHDLPKGTRPLLLDEPLDDEDEWLNTHGQWEWDSHSAPAHFEVSANWNHRRTRRPLPDLPEPDKVKSIESTARHAFHSTTEDRWTAVVSAVRAAVEAEHRVEVENLASELKDSTRQNKIVSEKAHNWLQRAESAEQRVKELEADLAHLHEVHAKDVCEFERQLAEKSADHLVDANNKDEPAWIEHDGGPCPLRDEEVEEWEIRYSDGDEEGFSFSPYFVARWEKTEGVHITHYRVHRWKPGYTATMITGPDGKVYTRHKPGDAMPCVADKLVCIINTDNVIEGPVEAHFVDWNNCKFGVKCKGWRYADEPAKEHDLSINAHNKSIRDNVDALLAQAGFHEDCSIRNQLSWMNFDEPCRKLQD